MKYYTGTSTNGLETQYGYIEDLWHNILEWVDGIYFSSNTMYCINNHNNFSDTVNDTKIGNQIDF